MMDNNELFNLLYVNMMLRNDYVDPNFDPKFAFDKEISEVLFDIYVLLLKSNQIDDQEFQGKFKVIMESGFNKLNKEQKQYIRDKIDSLVEESKKNNLKRERKINYE